jgi:hypothetical protein
MGYAYMAILAPCALIALVVLVAAIRPAASPAVAEVLRALTGPLSSLLPWSAKGTQQPEQEKIQAPEKEASTDPEC